MARATIPDEVWRQGPAGVNAEIKRLIAEHEGSALEADEANPEMDENENSSRDQSAFAPIFATRAALRVLPLLVTEVEKTNESIEFLFLSVFRALAVAWARTQYPSLVKPGSALVAARDVGAYGPFSGEAAFSVGSAAEEVALAAGAADSGAAAHRASRAVIQVKAAARAARPDGTLEVIVENANSDDVADIVPGVQPNQLSQIELWPGRDPPPFVAEQWETLKRGLRIADQGWDVWIDWYEARLNGRLRSQEVELAYVDYARTVSPDVSPKEANFEIKRLIDLHAPKPLPPTPEVEAGPTFQIGANGLSLEAPAPPGDFDPTLQSALQERLKRLCPNLVEATRRVGNTHPGLMAVIAEYAELVSQPLETLDVTSLWAVGTGLLANRDAFARLGQTSGMTEPLEPDHFALLQQVAEIHGAFILGFARGRELTDRADHSRLSADVLAAILPEARYLLDRWRRSKAMVEERTRNFFGAIEEAAIGPSWQAARAGYSVYAVTRNALIVVGKLLMHSHKIASTFVGGTALTAIGTTIDPGLVQTRLWIQFFLEQSQTILAFSAPFPELEVWLASMIDELKRDQDFRER